MAIDPRDDEEETPEAAEATRKVMALISVSLVCVIDVSSYVFARQKTGLFAMILPPMVIVTAAVLVFAVLMLRKRQGGDSG